MYIKIDIDGYILGHDYIETEEYNIKVSKADLVDKQTLAYNYKYINNELVKLSNEEKLNQPQYVSLLMNRIRYERNNLLKDSDFAILEDSPVDKQAWKAYRQSLRDLPNVVDVHNPIFPSKPGDE